MGEGREGATIDHTGCKENHAFAEGVLHWWKIHGSTFPAWWAEAARIVFALTPSLAAAERVFSMAKAMFGDQAIIALADYCHHAPLQQAQNWLSSAARGPLVVGPWCVRVRVETVD